MANPERGEVDLEVNGTRYRLALGIGGLRAIQHAASTPQRRVRFLDVVNGAAAGDIEYLCVLLWGALQRHHPEITQDGVDQLLDDLGGVQALPLALQKVNELMTATTPDARDQGTLKKTAARPRPEIPTTGTTGMASTSRPARSA